MTTIKFNDGVEFNIDGEYRIVRKSDGYYVVGQGLLCAVESREEGTTLIARFLSKNKAR